MTTDNDNKDSTKGGNEGTKGDDAPLLSAELITKLGLDGSDLIIAAEPGEADSKADGAEGKSTTEPGDNATEEDDDVEAVRAKARKAGEEEGVAKARKESEAAARKAADDARDEAAATKFQETFKNRIAAISSDDMVQKLVSANTAADLKAVLGEIAESFNAHHADGMKLYEPQVEARLAQDYTEQLFEAVDVALSAEAGDKLLEAHEARAKEGKANWQGVVTDVVMAAREGYLSQAKAEELAATALTTAAKNEKWLRARLSQVNSPGSRAATGRGLGGTSGMEIIEAHARGEHVDAKTLREAHAALPNTGGFA
jgi:hypothetical protein